MILGLCAERARYARQRASNADVMRAWRHGKSLIYLARGLKAKTPKAEVAGSNPVGSATFALQLPL